MKFVTPDRFLEYFSSHLQLIRQSTEKSLPLDKLLTRSLLTSFSSPYRPDSQNSSNSPVSDDILAHGDKDDFSPLENGMYSLSYKYGEY
jgi:hypothetical protein